MITCKQPPLKKVVLVIRDSGRNKKGWQCDCLTHLLVLLNPLPGRGLRPKQEKVVGGLALKTVYDRGPGLFCGFTFI